MRKIWERKFHDAGLDKEKVPLSELGAQPRCYVPSHFRETAQARARHSRGGGLHNIGQITRKLCSSNVVHQSAKLVSTSVRIGSQCS